jgi:hypothetical protein
LISYGKRTDVDAALGTRLCAHDLDGLDALLVFLGLRLATSTGVPGTVAGETELVVAPRAGDLLVALVHALGCAIVDGEVKSAFGGQAGNVMVIGSEEVLGKHLVIAALVRLSCLSR